MSVFYGVYGFKWLANTILIKKPSNKNHFMEIWEDIMNWRTPPTQLVRPRRQSLKSNTLSDNCDVIKVLWMPKLS